MRADSEEFFDSRDVIFKSQRGVKSPNKSASRLLLWYGGEFFILIRGDEVR